MTDIFADWKKNNFVVVGQDLLDKNEYMVVLTNVSYWINNELALANWCDQNGADMTGMVVTFPDEKTLTAFCLRWT